MIKKLFINKQIFTVLLIFSMILFSSILFYLINYVNVDIPFMDSLRFINYYDQFLNKEISIYDMYLDGKSQNRSILGFLYIYINASIFGLNIKLFSYFLVIFLLFSFLIITLVVFRLFDFDNNNRKFILFLTLFTIVSLLFSINNWELIFLDFGVILFFKNLTLILYWYFIYIFLQKEISDTKKWIPIYIFSICIVLLISASWSYSFVISTISVLTIYIFMQSKKTNLLNLLLLIFVLIFSLSLYIFIGKNNSLSQESLNIYNIFIGFLYYIFSVNIGIETSSALHFNKDYVLIYGFFIFVSSIYYSVRFIQNKQMIFPIFLIGYGIFTTIAMSITRCNIDLSGVASRHNIDVSYIYIGLLILIYYNIGIEKNLKFKKNHILLFVLIISVHLVGQAITWMNELQKAPYRKAAIEEYRKFILDRDKLVQFTILNPNSDLLQNQQNITINAIEVLKKYNLSVFKNIKYQIKLDQNSELLDGKFYQDNWVSQTLKSYMNTGNGKLNIDIYLPNENFVPNSLTLFVDDVFIGIYEIQESGTYHFEFNLDSNKNIELKAVFGKAINQKKLRLNEDERELSAIINKFEFEKIK